MSLVLHKISNDKKLAAKKLGVSPELIRSIVSLLKLPDSVQELIKDRKILFDAAQRINTAAAGKRAQNGRDNTLISLTLARLRKIPSKKFTGAATQTN